MSRLADLFPGFASDWIATSGGRIFVRMGGNGPPLLLLHGYPQTHAMWHLVAPELAQHFKLVIADLPGYGQSDVPETDPDHTPFTKRAMAQTMVQVMERLGHARFALAAHDRGGRVAYCRCCGAAAAWQPTRARRSTRGAHGRPKFQEGRSTPATSSARRMPPRPRRQCFRFSRQQCLIDEVEPRPNSVGGRKAAGRLIRNILHKRMSVYLLVENEHQERVHAAHGPLA
jgi:hypothetical protein